MINKGGFTLVELLIVIAIIGILASLTVISLNEARAKARDAKRRSDIGQLVKLVETYYYIRGNYPFCTDPELQPPFVGYRTCVSSVPQYWMTNLIADGYVQDNQTIVDPFNETKDGRDYIYLYSDDPDFIDLIYDTPPANGFPRFVVMYNLESGPAEDECGTNVSGLWSIKCGW